MGQLQQSSDRVVSTDIGESIAMRIPYAMFVLAIAAGAASCAQPARACSALSPLADGRLEASAVLADCLQRAPAGGRIDLPPGIYRLQQPLTITRSVTLATLGSGVGSPDCDQRGAHCATLLIDPGSFPSRAGMPVPPHRVSDDGDMLAPRP